MKKLNVSTILSIVINALIYLSFILCGFDSMTPYFVFVGLNVISFFYHYFMMTKKKMTFVNVMFSQILLLAIALLTYYGLLFININLQYYHFTTWIMAVVAIGLVIDYAIHLFKTRERKGKKEKEEA